MFSFEDFVLPEVPSTSRITPIKGGTPNIFLKKYEWVTPLDKIPSLELTLERRYTPTGFTDQLVETSVLLFSDPTQFQNGGPKHQKISTDQYTQIILAFRTDLTKADFNKKVLDWLILSRSSL